MPLHTKSPGQRSPWLFLGNEPNTSVSRKTIKCCITRHTPPGLRIACNVWTIRLPFHLAFFTAAPRHTCHERRMLPIRQQLRSLEIFYNILVLFFLWEEQGYSGSVHEGCILNAGQTRALRIPSTSSVSGFDRHEPFDVLSIALRKSEVQPIGVKT